MKKGTFSNCQYIACFLEASLYMCYIFVDSDQALGSIKILDLSLKFIIFKLFTCQEWMTKFSRK